MVYCFRSEHSSIEVDKEIKESPSAIRDRSKPKNQRPQVNYWPENTAPEKQGPVDNPTADEVSHNVII